MVPTALTITKERSPGSGRQHIGKPFGRRAAARRTTSDDPKLLKRKMPATDSSNKTRQAAVAMRDE